MSGLASSGMRLSIRLQVGRPARVMRSVALAAALFPAAGGAPARALDIGPKAIPLTVAGVAVEIPVTGKLDA